MAKPKKAGARKTKKRSNVEQLVQIQQRSVGRVATMGTKAAKRVMEGNFEVNGWMALYTDLWKELADDFAQALKVIYPPK